MKLFTTRFRGNAEPRDYPDEYAFYACSPHRLEMTAHLTRHGYAPAIAGEVLLLLPEWTQWCLSQGGVDGEFAGRSLETARAMASLAGSEVVMGANPEDEAPFRRQE